MTKLQDSYGVQLADMIARSTISEQWSDLSKDSRRQLKRQFLKAARRKLRRERRSSPGRRPAQVTGSRSGVSSQRLPGSA